MIIKDGHEFERKLWSTIRPGHPQNRQRVHCRLIWAWGRHHPQALCSCTFYLWAGGCDVAYQVCCLCYVVLLLSRWRIGVWLILMWMVEGWCWDCFASMCWLLEGRGVGVSGRGMSWRGKLLRSKLRGRRLWMHSIISNDIVRIYVLFKICIPVGCLCCRSFAWTFLSIFFTCLFTFFMFFLCFFVYFSNFIQFSMKIMLFYL